MELLTKLLAGIAIASAIAVSQATAQSTTLTVGPGASNFELQANTANQVLNLYVSSTSSQVTGGANILLDLGSGGPAISIDSLDGTIYQGGGILSDSNQDPFGLNVGLLGPIPSPEIDGSGNQILASLLVDTTGISAGIFNLDFTGTTINDGFAQPINYGLVGATTISISSVPEPGSVTMSMLVLTGLGLVRRRTRHTQQCKT